MSTETTSLFSLARNKLQSVVGGGVKDSCSLHRWVLLKNSIIRSHPPLAAHDATDEADADSVYRHEEEESLEEDEQDTFMFPDPHYLLPDETPAAGIDERQWLDSLLEGLEDDEDDDYSKLDGQLSALPTLATDDVAEPLSPLYSPMSSSDDLADQSNYFSYPMPYPPPHPPLIPSWFELQAPSDSALTSPVILCDNPLPYYAVDDLEDLPVPDAIEDTSDDESDAPSTPSATSTSSLAPINSSSISTPPGRTRFLSDPQVYVDTDDSHFYPFELDPLPFPGPYHAGV
ncbi:hypothetical protein PHLCEN_2v751, partial [Hermanssonia centrifuga]